MSIKKLGGIRLRLIVGLMAVLAITGVLLARSPYTMTFNPNDIPATTIANLTVSGLTDGVEAYLVPTQGGSADFEGWVLASTQTGDATNGYVFVSNTSPGSLKINGMGNPIQSSSGSVTIKLQTSNPVDDLNAVVELRSTPSGSAVQSGSIWLREQ